MFGVRVIYTTMFGVRVTNSTSRTARAVYNTQIYHCFGSYTRIKILYYDQDNQGPKMSRVVCLCCMHCVVLSVYGYVACVVCVVTGLRLASCVQGLIDCAGCIVGCVAKCIR